MIDNVKIRIPYHIPIPETPKPFDYNGLIFSPQFSNGTFSYYKSDLNGLFITYHDIGGMSIDRSFHKFLRGTNGDDLHLSEIHEIVKRLSHGTGVPIEGIMGADLRRFEVGVNIHCPHKETLLKGLKMTNGSPLLPMWDKNGDIRGLKLYRKQYEIKIYDKYIEQLQSGYSLPVDTLRVELKVKRLQYVQNLGLNIEVFSDLLIHKNLFSMTDIITNKLMSLALDSNIDAGKLSLSELRTFALFKDEGIINKLKVDHPKTFERERSKFKRLSSKFQSEPITETVNLIQAKAKELIGDAS